ncbi:MAG: hypothetical protein IPM79_38750 [Polyangiaceae bacterium]|jgi:hypothetical protein|nr:hypothetical protein [Polyangiaceae bacterium]MBK8943389.1 hypothetical protein [Polyangiaceae bacterium]
MKLDDDWGEWAADYRHATGPGPDAAEIVEKARRGTTKQVAKLALEIVASLFAIVVLAVLSAKVERMWPLASLVIPGVMLSLGYSIHARRGTWSAAAQTVSAFVELEWRRQRVELTLLRVGQVSFIVFVTGFSIWLPYFLASGRERLDDGPWFLIARLCFAVLSLGATWLYLGHKVRRSRDKLARLERVRRSVTDGVEPQVAL